MRLQRIVAEQVAGVQACVWWVVCLDGGCGSFRIHLGDENGLFNLLPARACAAVATPCIHPALLQFGLHGHHQALLFVN